mgnify:CR=1 FL=1
MSEQTVRNRRTQAEVLEDLETRVAQLRERERMKGLQDHPDIAPLISEKDGILKQINIIRRGLGTGPQSFDERVAKHESWIERIKEEALSAEADIERLTVEAETLKTGITEAMDAISGKE